MGARLHQATPGELSAVLYSLALLNHQPGLKWMVRFFQVRRHAAGARSGFSEGAASMAVLA